MLKITFPWDGILETAIASYFRSTSCPVHALVDATLRNGDQFVCPWCGSVEHADEPASDTVGNHLLLRPMAVA